jgi:hypothetical protein
MSPLVEPQLQPPPKLRRQPSLKQVQYFFATPAGPKDDGEPAIPKNLGSLLQRRLKRRLGRGVSATFNFLSGLDEQQCVDESGFAYQHDELTQQIIRPQEEQRWILEADGANEWSFHYLSGNDHGGQEVLDHRLLLSRKASDF